MRTPSPLGRAATSGATEGDGLQTIAPHRYDRHAVNPRAATLRFAVFPRSGLVADSVLVLAGALLVAVAAQIAVPLPFTPVPLTFQPFGVLLVGAALGATRGATSLGLYVLLGLLGAPFYAPGETEGLARLLGPTGGYLLSYPLAAALTGWLAERRWDRRFPSALVAMLAGSVVIYAIGLPWLAAATGASASRTLELGLYPFVPGDLLKVLLASALLPGAWRLVQRTRGDGR